MMNSIHQQREEAKQKAWYARVGLRRRLEQQPIEVEEKNAKWKRQGEEQAAREAEAHAARKAREQRGIREQRAFEIQLAKANNEVDAELLNAISAALTSLVERVEALEAHVGINGDKLTTETLDLPRFLSPKYGSSLGWPEDMRFSQPLMTKSK